jgi:hypothetical protein
VKVRSLALLPALAIVCLGAAACDSKAGTAASVGTARVSETQLNNYLTPNAQPITDSQGGSTPARSFVLQTILRNEVLPKVLAATGGTPSETEVAQARVVAMQGNSDAAYTSKITDLGLSARFEPVFTRSLALVNLLTARLTSQAQLDAALQKAHADVSVSPRYGAWNQSGLSITDMSGKQVPSFLKYDGKLPGDQQLTPQQ